MNAAVRGPILVVEDDLDAGDILEELLRYEGMLALRARSVAEAVAALESVRVAYVVTDCAMAGEDGLSLIRRMREHPSWRAIPVTMVSGQDATGAIAVAARALGASFMAKPLDLTKLSALIRHGLDARLELPRVLAKRAGARSAEHG